MSPSPEARLEEPTRPCDSGEVGREEQRRADQEYTEWLARRRAEWERERAKERQ